MLYLVLAVLTSTSLLVIFKIFDSYKINTFQAIVVNYWVCALTGFLLLPDASILKNFWSQDWFPFALLLSTMFISGFWVIGMTTQKIGLTVSSIAGKTSMVLPVVAAFFLYGDTVSVTKILGVFLAILAVFLTSVRDKEQIRDDLNKIYLFFPLILFIMSGSIEIILNYAQVVYLSDALYVPFLILLFGLAGVWGLIILLFQLATKQTKIETKNIIAGIALGVPNYFSLHYILLALGKSGLESSVFFPICNISIVSLSAISAFIFFREKLSRINLAGLAAAIGAITLIMI
ncbi:MAG: hypothetical protein ACPG5B_02085 [Chitinophagales bacterium]